MMTNEERIDRSLDGLLSDAEMDQLTQDILNDRELKQLYTERCWLHAQLTIESGTLLSDTPEAHGRDRKKIIPILSYAAALVGIAALALSLLIRQSGEGVAILTEAKNCRWAASDLPTREGSKLRAGTLDLVEGLATIRFESGATVTLEAPCTLTVASAMECRLVSGSVVADVPESAHGFTIHTDQLEVVDLGTKFGVTSSPLGSDNVFVFEGEVEVHRETSDTPDRITTGQSIHTDATLESSDDEAVRFVAPAPAGGNWTAITTAIGRGGDTYMRLGEPTRKFGDDPLLMVKHTEMHRKNERRALLAFDLRSVEGALIETRLSLQMESSGLGFSSLVPDSHFTVYAIRGDKTRSWDEKTLSWKNAGALVAASLPPSRFAPVADFTIERGSPNTLIELTDLRLKEWLETERGSVVRFLIVRTTGESDKQGLVHAFASKEHPTATPPTLWIRTAP